MTASELIAQLSRLPPGAEVALLAASGFARPPEIEKVNPDAGWKSTIRGCGLNNPRHAFLIRPAKDII